MTFGIDISAALGIQRSGIGNYVFNLVDNLIQIDTRNEYYLFTSKTNTNNPFQLTPNFQLKNKYNLFNNFKNFDSIHGPDFKLPPIRAKKKIITIHDLASFSNRGFMSKDFEELTKKKVIKAVNKADIIITVSNTIKSEIEKEFPATIGRIISVHHGVDKQKSFVDDLTVRTTIVEKYNLPDSFLLFVGNLETRKNLITLLKAFITLKDKFNIKHKLVFVGKSGFGYESIKKFIYENKLNEDVKIIGWVEDDDLYTIYSLAELFVFPSFYEGFGLPIIEAMKCKLPIIISDIPTHREVADDAAKYFSTTNDEELANSIISLLQDETQKNNLIQKGFDRAHYFDWTKTAKQTLKIYES